MAIRDGCYHLGRNFGRYNVGVREYIELVYGNSLKYYQDNYILRNVTGTAREDIMVIDNSMEYLEDYLYYIYFSDKDNFLENFDYFKKNLKIVSVLPKNERGLYGKFLSDLKAVFVNPKMSSSSTLSANERIRLYMYHELGHVINSRWMENVIKLIENTGGYQGKMQLMYDGASLLDEAITQDRAENIVYMVAGKERPREISRSNNMFGGLSYNTNFDYYGELQMPAVTFGRTLRGIGKLDNKGEVLFELDKRAIGGSFMNDVFNEYERDGHINDLCLMLSCLGVIKNASYSRFGYGDKVYLNESKKALEEFNMIAIPLRDYRESYKKSSR